MEDGSGLLNIIPPLDGADYLELYPENLPCLIKAGYKGDITVNGKIYSTEMPGIPKLTEFEITNVINYINTSWSNNNKIVKHLDVRKALKECE